MSRKFAGFIITAVWAVAALGQAELTNGLVAYWNFEQTALYNAMEGGDATVATGDPSVGVYGTGTSRVGSCSLVLDGDDSIQLPYGSTQLGDSFSISAWYYYEETGVRQSLFEATGNYDVSYATTDSLRTQWCSWVGQNEYFQGDPKAFSEWHHVVQVFTASGGTTTLDVYEDGSYAGSVSAATADVGFSRLYVGTYRNADGRYFLGQVDEFALWDRALTGDEAGELYSLGSAGQAIPMPELPPVLVGSFQLHGVLAEPTAMYYDNLNTRIANGAEGTAGVVLGTIDVLTGENPMSSSPPVVQRYSSTSIFQQLNRYGGHDNLIAFDYDFSTYLSMHPAGTSLGQFEYELHLEYSNRRLSGGANLNILLSYSDGSTIALDTTDIGGGVDMTAGDSAAMVALAGDTGKYVFLDRHVANSSETGTISVDITSYIAASTDGKIRVLFHDEGEYKGGINIQNASGIVATKITTSLTPFEAWLESHGLSDGGADSDGDGVNNLSEFGLGGNPTNSADQGILPTSSVDASFMTYVYPKRLNSGLTYTLETCTDLVTGTWTNSGYTLIDTGSINAEFGAVTNQISTAVENKQFVRLIIEE